ncbi:MAG: PAS domain S-box protein [Dehalococcoidia bacterium]
MPAAIVAVAVAVVAAFPDRFSDALVLGAFLLVAIAAFSQGIMHARREDAKVRHAEAALEESERRFRNLGDGAPVMIWITDDALMPTFVSQAWMGYTGISPAEIERDAWHALRSTVHPDDLEGTTQAFLKALKNHDKFSHEYRLRRFDGEYRWVLDSGISRLTDAGEYMGYAGIIIDVDDHRKAEAALRTSEQRLRMLVENVPLVQYVTDKDGTFLLVEGRALEQLDISPEVEPVGRSAFELYADNEEIKDKLRRALAGESVTSTVEFLDVWWDVYYTPIFAADGTVAGATVVGLDVTERERAKGALEESEMRYRLIARATIDAIWDWDLATGHIWRSEGFTTRFGYPAEAIGDNVQWWAERVHSDDLQQAVAVRDAFVASGDSDLHMEYRYLRADGAYARVVNRIHAVRDEDGKATRLVGSLTDVTEQRELEQQFLHVQKMETVGRLAGGIAHDFSNLMTAIMVNAELDLIATPSPEVLRADLEEIKATAERAAGLSRQLLSFARRQIIEPQVLSLNDLMESTERMLQRLIGANIDLRVERTEEPTTVRIDPSQLEQVLVNMVVNARDAMPEGGDLTIRTQRVARATGTSLPPSVDTGGYVLLEVRDTGIGMTEDVRQHVFEPFFTTKPVGGGTGLGLPTSYGIVKQAGGDVVVESEPGHGAIFRIYLPFVAAALDEIIPSFDGAMPAGKETILLVEDEAGVRKSASRALRQLGYCVIEAADGNEGLAAATATPTISLIITDLVMPQLGGKELAQRLTKSHPGIRILFLSGYTDDAAIRAGISEHAVDFLAKPFSPSALAQKVRDMLDRAPAARQPTTTAR